MCETRNITFLVNCVQKLMLIMCRRDFYNDYIQLHPIICDYKIYFFIIAYNIYINVCKFNFQIQYNKLLHGKAIKQLIASCSSFHNVVFLAFITRHVGIFHRKSRQTEAVSIFPSCPQIVHTCH